MEVAKELSWSFEYCFGIYRTSFLVFLYIELNKDQLVIET